MKTLRFAFKTMLVVTAMSLVFTSCKKKETEDNDTGSSTDNAFAEASFNDIAVIADQASAGSTPSYRSSEDNGSLLSNCATITFDTANQSNVDTMTIDFGTTNCACADGRYRRGKIIVQYTGLSFPVHYRDSGMTATITTSNYFVNDNQILGTKTVTNNGWNSSQHLTWSINVNGTIHKANNGGTVTWNTTKTKELLAGQASHGAPITWGTAKVGITGSAYGTSANGHNFTATVITQLVRDFSCIANRRHIVSGKLDFAPANKPVRHIDFGTGACDDIATVTIGNNVYTVHMH